MKILGSNLTPQGLKNIFYFVGVLISKILCILLCCVSSYVLIFITIYSNSRISLINFSEMNFKLNEPGVSVFTVSLTYSSSMRKLINFIHIWKKIYIIWIPATPPISEPNKRVHIHAPVLTKVHGFTRHSYTSLHL